MNETSPTEMGTRMKSKLIIAILLTLSQILAQTDILLPDTLSGPNYNLVLQNDTFQFTPDITSPTMGVNGPVLGPTLIMNRNDNVSIFVENQLGEETTIHWHGMHVSAENDGGPHTVINPGETWNPQFTVLDKAGTYGITLIFMNIPMSMFQKVLPV